MDRHTNEAMIKIRKKSLKNRPENNVLIFICLLHNTETDKSIYKNNMKVAPKVLIVYDKSLGYNQKTADSIININYPKDKIRIVEFTEESLEAVLDDFKLGDYEFLFYINSNVELVNADYLNILINSFRAW